VAWGYLESSVYLIPIALLMGGTVVGIAYQGERKLNWASQHPLLWKILVVFLGMPAAYFFITNLSKSIVITELILLILIAHFFFIKRPAWSSGSKPDKSLPADEAGIRDIEEQMKQCC
jgi:drug/metabolite transporter (DMT)-like permease